MYRQLLLIVLLLFCQDSWAQLDTLPMEVYQRAISYTSPKLINKRVFNLQPSFNYHKDSSGLWYVFFSPAGRQYRMINFDGFAEQPLFDHQALAQALSKSAGKKVEANQIQLSNLEAAKNQLTFFFSNKKYQWDSTRKSLEILKSEEDTTDDFESISPDGNFKAFAKDYNLYIQNIKTKVVTALSKDGTPDYAYGSWYGWFDEMFGENKDREPHFSVQWSPDSKYLITQVCDISKANKMYMLNHSIDTLYRAQLVSYFRGSPGDSGMVMIKPLIYSIAQLREVKHNFPTQTHINSVELMFTADSKSVIAHWLERGFKNRYIAQLDLATSKSTILWKESTATSIDHSFMTYVQGWEKLVLESEKSGWNQLYEIDLRTGKTQELSVGNFFVHDVLKIDTTSSWIYFTASGREYDDNPYYQKLYKVKSGSRMMLLTAEEGNHQVSLDPGARFFTDAISTLDQPTQTVLRDLNTGEMIKPLTEADVNTAENEGWVAPMTFSCIAKDGYTTIFGAVWKPTNFDPNKSYPIIDATYTGPHTQIVPHSFDMAFRYQSWAELGFVVVVVDGLGTAGRSKAFREFSYQNMGDNLRDHVVAIRHLASKYSWLDTTRVGIFGHSAGGYDAGHALLAFPDFYKVGVASAGDHDFRMEKAWWPEMYMGWPVTEKYDEVSNITLAPNLKGKLMIAHGGMDHNVNASATFKLAEALIKANKDFDLVILPSQRHGFEGASLEFFQKKRWNYFIRHLLGKEPRWDYNISE